MHSNKNKKEKTGNEKGFTLMEMLVYIGVLSILILALSFFIVWSINSTNKARTMREALYNTRRAIEIMTYEIREAKIISPNSTTTHLYLENTTTTEFYLCDTASTTICQKKGSGEPILLTSDKVEVKKLEFKQIATNTTTPSVQISLTVSYKNPSNVPEYQTSVDATTTVSIRGY